jgi:hypothetical protein
MTTKILSSNLDINSIQSAITSLGNLTALTVNNGSATSLFVGPPSGGVSYYGDANNAAIRTNGSVYFQNANGTATNVVIGPTSFASSLGVNGYQRLPSGVMIHGEGLVQW